MSIPVSIPGLPSRLYFLNRNWEAVHCRWEFGYQVACSGWVISAVWKFRRTASFHFQSKGLLVACPENGSIMFLGNMVRSHPRCNTGTYWSRWGPTWCRSTTVRTLWSGGTRAGRSAGSPSSGGWRRMYRKTRWAWRRNTTRLRWLSVKQSKQ